MIFFTSDLHIGHKGIIEFCNRPFRDTAEMQNILIQNYNSIVEQDDTVYILGDLTYKLPLDEANNIIAHPNGHKHLICGNHDMKYDDSLFEEVCVYKQLFTHGGHFTLMHPCLNGLKCGARVFICMGICTIRVWNIICNANHRVSADLMKELM